MKPPCPTCLQFPDFVPSSTTQKLYLNAAQNVTVNCPDGSTPTVAIPAGVVGYLLNFELGTPPYPDITLNCIGGQIVVSVPDNTNSGELDVLINQALNKCAAQIGLQLGCVSGEFVNTQQTVTCPESLFANIAGALPVGVSVSGDAHSLIAAAGLISSTISVQDSNLKATQLLNELIATGNAVCAGRIPPTPTPDQLWYKFPEGSGFVTVDFSAAGNNGSSIPGWTTGPDGDGAVTGQFLTDNSSVCCAGDFTYSLWINPSGTPSSTTFILLELLNTSTFGHEFDLIISASKHLEFMGVYPTVLGTSSGIITFGVWTMVSFTYISATGVMVFYINGVPSGTATATTAALPSGNIYPGGDGAFGHSAFTGDIADLRIWSTALSATDILNIFNAGAQ